MKKPSQSSIGLRGLMLTFVLLAVLATLANCLIVAYSVQRDALVRAALEANRAYAFKVASSIDELLRSVHQRLRYSSQLLGENFESRDLLKHEVKRIQAQDSELNTVMIIDASGKALESYEKTPDLLVSALKSDAIKQALSERRALISHAYTNSAGNSIVIISQPIFNSDGQFLGIIGGAIYLEKHSVISALLSSHDLESNFTFVVDENRRLLYHPEHQKIGQIISTSDIVDAAFRGKNGAMEATNYQNIQMLAGYAYVAEANWAVVSQQPRVDALAPLKQLTQEMLVRILPTGAIGFFLILLAATLITRPLRQLADSARHLSDPGTTEQLQAIRSWYAEAAAIRQALVAGVQLLQNQLGSLSKAAESDPLTGLANRRAMDAALSTLDKSDVQYSALALDIDHFKRINDSFGHDVGDLTLQHVAQVFQQYSRANDLVCRAGGEEFFIFLPETDLEAAHDIAERIRSKIANTQIAQIGALTISIGVACRGIDTPTSDLIMKRADERLYLAKNTGRNRVVAES